MAGDDDREGIGPVGSPNSPGSIWLADLFCDLPISAGFTVGDLRHSLPDSLVKGSSGSKIQRDSEFGSVSVQILADLDQGMEGGARDDELRL